MDSSSLLMPAYLIKRYKRFLADIFLEEVYFEPLKKAIFPLHLEARPEKYANMQGYALTIACPNTGSMLGLSSPGMRLWFSVSQNPKRKYPLTWELVELQDSPLACTFVGINPQRPNQLVWEAFSQDFFASSVPLLAREGRLVRREVKYGENSRVDFLLEGKNLPPCYIEVKNVHLSRQNGLCEFPDSKTERGVKHLTELAKMASQGARAFLLYVVQRADCDRFQIAEDIDPLYAQKCREVEALGVEFLVYRCHVSPSRIGLSDRIWLEK